MSKGKLIFADLIRITAMLLIVFWHVIANTNEFGYLKFGIWFHNLIYINIGAIAVALFFFISGVSLQYNHAIITSCKDFYIKRLTRIYPALWLSVIFGLLIMPRDVLPVDAAKVMWSLSGVFALFRVYVLNPWTWFLGTIIIFYLIFPFLSSAISKWTVPSMIFIFTLSASSRYLLNVYPIYITPDQWGFFDVLMPSTFPLSNLFTFSLGIFSIQRGFFPENIHNIKALSFISALSYPIYLIHGFLLGPYMGLSEMFVWKLVVLSLNIYILDTLIQKKLNNIKQSRSSQEQKNVI